MKSSRMRKLAVLLMLACAGAQPALGETLIASALALGIHASDHAHSVALRSDGSHLAIVLSHGEHAAPDQRRAAQGPEHLAGVSERDHVVHFTASETANANPRRALLDAAPVLASTLALATPAAPAWAPAHSHEPRARGVDHLRTIVLRL